MTHLPCHMEFHVEIPSGESFYQFCISIIETCIGRNDHWWWPKTPIYDHVMFSILRIFMQFYSQFWYLALSSCSSTFFLISPKNLTKSHEHISILLITKFYSAQYPFPLKSQSSTTINSPQIFLMDSLNLSYS